MNNLIDLTIMAIIPLLCGAAGGFIVGVKAGFNGGVRYARRSILPSMINDAFNELKRLKKEKEREDIKSA